MVKFHNHCVDDLNFSADFFQRGPGSPRKTSPPRAPSAPVATGMWVPNESVMNSLIESDEELSEADPYLGSSTDGLVRNFAPQDSSGVVTRRPRRGRRPRAFRRSDFFFDRRPYDPMVVWDRVRHPCPFGRRERSTHRDPVQQVDSWDWDYFGGCKYRLKFVSQLEGLEPLQARRVDTTWPRVDTTWPTILIN